MKHDPPTVGRKDEEEAPSDDESSDHSSDAGESAGKSWIVTQCSNLAFAILFITYPSCSKTVFSYFRCESWDGAGEDGRSYLRVDRSLDCESPEYITLLPYAYVMLALYP